MPDRADSAAAATSATSATRVPAAAPLSHAFDDACEPWSNVEWFVLALIALPFAVGIVALLVGSDPHTRFVGDNALNELRLGDVGNFSVLLGPYSRDGWSHPGPSLYYLFAVPYRLLGHRSSSFAAGALVLNGLCALGIVVIARRISGRIVMLLTAAAVGTLLVNLGWEFLRNPWNPYVTVLPLGALFASCWAVAGGRWRYLPAVAALATFCVQTHIAYLPMTVPVVLWALGGASISHRGHRRSEATASRRVVPIVTTIAVLALMWIPPVVDQLDGMGNLNATRVYFQHQSDRQGFERAIRVVGDEFTLAPHWLVGSEPPVPVTSEPRSLYRTPVPFLGLVWLAIGVTTWRRQRRDLRQLAVGTLVLTAAALVAVATTTGTLFDYRLRVLWVVGVFGAIVGLGLAARGWLRTESARRAVVGALLGALLATTGGATVAATTGRLPDAELSARLRTIERGLTAHLRPGPGVFLLRAASFPAANYLGTIMLELEAAGIPVRVAANRAWELTFGAHRILRREPVRAVLTIAVDHDVDAFRRRPSTRLVAWWSAEPRRARTRDLAELGTLSAEAGRHGLSPATTRRIGRLLGSTRAIAVFSTVSAG